MRVFVTGATGIIGHAVALAFSQRGHHVSGLVRSEAKAERLRRAEITPILGDINQPQTYQAAAADAEVLVHCAADMSGNMPQSDATCLDTLLHAANKAKAPRAILYTSGCWLSGNTQGKVVDEASATQPLKLVAWRPAHETKLFKDAAHHVRTVSIRPGCVYGHAGSLTGIWFGSAQQGAVMRIGAGQNYMATIHADDLAEAYVLAAEQEVNQIVLNITHDAFLQQHAMVHAVSVAAGIAGKIHEVTSEDAAKNLGMLVEGLTCDQKLSNQRAKRVLGWAPRHADFVSGIDTYYAAWKAHQK